jgi:hypothetical protein
MKRVIYLFIIGLLLGHTLAAQGLEIQLEGLKYCDQAVYCMDLNLQASAPENPVAIGSSSILLQYNASALAFQSYTPAQYDPSVPCNGASGSAWDVHQYDAYAHPGEFNLVLYLADEDMDCPPVIGDTPVKLGRICFDIRQQGGAPAFAFDMAHTHFNSQSTNDGNSPLAVTNIEIVNAPDLLACDCPGEGEACDDGNVYTVNDKYDLHCVCRGEQQDTDQDGILDGIDPCYDIYVEAEASGYDGPVFSNNQPQFYGLGFLDFNNDPAQYVAFEVDVAEAGSHTISFRYASNTSDRSLHLIIDDDLIDDAFAFPETGSWANWQEVSLVRFLSAGQHTITLRSNGSWGPNIDRMALSVCNGCSLAGQPCDDGNPCTIDDVFDADCACGGRTLDDDNDQISDYCDEHIGDASDFPLEVGVLRAVSDDWQTVTLNNSYESMVVIATPHLANQDMLPVVSRVRNAAGHTFEVKVQNPGGPVEETYNVFYVVAEEGVYKAENDGIRMEVVKAKAELTADKAHWGNRETRTYQQDYEQPVVLGQVMSALNNRWSVFWASSVSNHTVPPTAAGFAAGKHKGEDLNSSRVEEVIGYMVIEAGTYELKNKILEAAVGSVAIGGMSNNNGYDYLLDNPTAKGAVLSASGIRGNNGYWPVLFGLEPVDENAITLVADEDQMLDSERAHIDEAIAYLAFEESLCLYDADNDGVCDEDDRCPGYNDLADVDQDAIPDACDDCDNTLTGKPCDDGNPCTILDKYDATCNCVGIPMDGDQDGICNWEDLCEGFDDNIDVDGDGIPDGCDPNVGDASTMPLETGMVSGISDEWQWVQLEKTYDNMVVVATVHLTSGALPPVVSRVRNAEGNRFELKIQNPSGPIDHVYDVYYFVVEEGVYQQAYDGISMEARLFNSTMTAGVGAFGQREARTYAQNYINPVVLGQVMTAEDDRWSVFWSSRANSQSSPPTPDNFAAGKHIGADTITERAAETLGVVIFEQGKYNLSGIDFEVRVGEDIINGINTSGYAYPLDIPQCNGAVLSATGMDGGDGQWPVLFTETPFGDGTITLAVDEDQITDSERYHTDEQVAYLAFYNPEPGGQLIEQGAQETTTNTLEEPVPPIWEPQILTSAEKVSDVLLFPNPVSDELSIIARLPGEQLQQLVIMDAKGKVVLTQLFLKPVDGGTFNCSIDVNSLADGIYFIQLKGTKGTSTERFIKAAN